MLWFVLILACDITGKWRDYAFNGAQIPATFCETSNNCILIEQFSLELNEDLQGDFRIQIGREGEHYIYTLPASAIASGEDWTVTIDNTDYPKMATEWLCDVTGRLLVCDVAGETYQFRRSGHPD